ncbi:MAG: anti-sigma factor domain-containing protein [Anaerolineae bacterium]
MNRKQLFELIPAYAIGALDPDEQTELEAFIATDAEAQVRLQEYEAIASVLPFTTASKPAPADLKADLRKRLAARQSITVLEKPASLPTQVAPPPVVDASPPPTPARMRMLYGLATVAAVLVLVIGLMAVLQREQAQPTLSSEDRYQQLIEQADSMRYDLTPDVATTAHGELVIAADGSLAVLHLASLPDTSEQESYQLWLITEGDVHSAGIFHWSTGSGPFFIPIEQALDDVVAIGMTIEPYEGSPLGDAPTGERLFAIEVTRNS